MSTKQRILDQALLLFNAKGSHAVSTNHLAEALSMSPGNLYYHFKNKEEIILALYEALAHQWDQQFQLDPDTPPQLSDVVSLMKKNFALISQYRFLYREMSELMRRDPLLARRYQSLRSRGFAGFNALVNAFVAQGIFNPLSPAEIDTLATQSWLLSEFWLTFAEQGGHPVNAALIEEGLAHFKRLMHPYLNQEKAELLS